MQGDQQAPGGSTNITANSDNSCRMRLCNAQLRFAHTDFDVDVPNAFTVNSGQREEEKRSIEDAKWASR